MEDPNKYQTEEEAEAEERLEEAGRVILEEDDEELGLAIIEDVVLEDPIIEEGTTEED